METENQPTLGADYRTNLELANIQNQCKDHKIQCLSRAGPVAQRLEQGTHNLAPGKLAGFVHGCIYLYFQRFRGTACKRIQAHLDRYPLQYPLQWIMSVSSSCRLAE